MRRRNYKKRTKAQFGTQHMKHSVPCQPMTYCKLKDSSSSKKETCLADRTRKHNDDLDAHTNRNLTMPQIKCKLQPAKQKPAKRMSMFKAEGPTLQPCCNMQLATDITGDTLKPHLSPASTSAIASEKLQALNWLILMP